MRNIVTSLREINFFDWAGFVEEVSLVDAALREESSYGEMSFATRDRYRHAIEELSKGSETSELDVAQATLGAGQCPASRSAPRAIPASS